METEQHETTVARITGADHSVRVSDKDAGILAQRAAAWADRKGPRVGDFVIFADGGTGRFTHSWGDDIQTTVRGGSFGPGSFYLTDEGRLSYSGALDPAIPKANLTDTGDVRMGAVWFFHDGWMRAHSSVRAVIPCRVYREATSTDGGAS